MTTQEHDDDWRSDILDFWFGLDDKQWWRGGDELDQQIRDRFLELWREKRALPVDAFLADATTAIAAVILFDQLPRNMFRGDAEQFSTDHIALAIARRAIDKGFDDQLPPRERAFLYLPFEHSEQMDDQNRAILLFTALGDEHMLHFAKLHHDIIERFGRFPHRNEMLGRPPRPDEIAAGDVVPW